MIALIGGYDVLLDDDDYEQFVLKCKPWSPYIQHGSQVYFVRIRMENGIRHTDKLHRVIMGMSTKNNLYVDHINGNTLDNRKSNLRVCSRNENARNKKTQSNNVSGYKGVCYRKDKGIYQARIWLNGTNRHLGFFINPEDAHNAYCVAAAEHFGEFARFN